MQGQAGADVGAALVGIVCGLAIGLPIGLAIGAIILRAACWLYNKMAAPESAVPDPSFLKAMGIALVAMIVQVIIGFGMGLVLGVAGTAAGMNEQAIQLISAVLGIPVGLFVSAGTFTLMLPTTFLRGLAVAALQIVITIAIAIVIGGMIFAVFAITAGFR